MSLQNKKISIMSLLLLLFFCLFLPLMNFCRGFSCKKRLKLQNGGFPVERLTQGSSWSSGFPSSTRTSRSLNVCYTHILPLPPALRSFSHERLKNSSDKKFFETALSLADGWLERADQRSNLVKAKDGNSSCSLTGRRGGDLRQIKP